MDRLVAASGHRPQSVEAKSLYDRARALSSAAPAAEAREAHSELVRAAKALNAAVLADREAFGGAWPVQTVPVPKAFEDEALQRQ